MSYLKPDYNYRPMTRTGEFLTDGEPTEEQIQQWKTSKDSLGDILRTFHKSISDEELKRYQGNTSIAFKTNINVLDSVSFFKKFSDSFLASIRLTFPDQDEDFFEKLEILLNDIEKHLAQSLKHSNVENRFLLLLSSAMLESLLNYENY